MRKFRLHQLLLLVLLILSMAIIAVPQQKPAVEVWAVASGENNKVYHCPGSRWFGVGNGKKIAECQAIHEGYRPALGTGCGSTCLQSSSVATPGSAPTRRNEQDATKGRSL
ncbi:MAG: hypothetical protein LAO56_13225 [Acidobacteriia bacterium]|nr:hypothetical protein [Terriglobia bacterium]